MARAGRARRRWWLVPLGLLLGLGGLLLLLLVLVQTSFAREQLRQQVNNALLPMFAGRIQIDRIGYASLWGVRGVDARVYDPQGRQVIRVQGLSAVASLSTLALQLALHGDGPELGIAQVHIDYADVTLREDEELGVTLATTFLPHEDEPPAPPSSGPGPHLHIDRITFDRVWAHGRVSGSPQLDAELTDLLARLDQSTADGFNLDLDHVELVTRAMPLGSDPRGNVSAHIEVPQEGGRPMRLEGMLDGHAVQSPLGLEVRWIGDDLYAHVSLPRVPADFVNQNLAGLALDGELAIVADIDGQLPQLDFDVEVDGTAGHAVATGYLIAAEGLEVAVNLSAARLDLARIAPAAPGSELRLAARALLFEGEPSSFVGAYRLDVDSGALAGQATPATWLNGKLELGAEQGLAASGKLGVAEPGAPVLGDYRVRFPEHAEGQVAVSLQSQLDEPQRLRALDVHTAGSLSASALLEPTSGRFSAKARIDLSHLDFGSLQARSVQLAGQASGSLAAPHVQAAATLDLLSGRAHADLDYTPQRQRLSLFAADIDLLRLARVMGQKLPLKQATGALDMHVERSSASATLQIDGKAGADLGKLGSVELLATALKLPDSAPTLAHLGRGQGELAARGNLDLVQLSPLLVAAKLPIERTTGRVRFELSAKRGADDTRPLQLAAQLDTNGLRIVEQRQTSGEISNTAEATADQPRALEGIDLHLSLHAEPHSGEAVATLLLRDHGGTLADIQAEAQLARLWPGGFADLTALRQMPLKVRIEVPRRKLQSLPLLLRPAALRGRVALTATLQGSLGDPQVEAQVLAESLRSQGSAQPLNLQADLVYAPSGGKAAVVAKLTRSGATALDLSSEWEGDLLRAPALVRGERVLVASARARLADFPIDVIPSLVDRQIVGRLNGELKLRNWGRDAVLDAHLQSTSLSVGKIAIQDLRASARNDSGKLLAELALRSGGGACRASLDADMSWGSKLAPVLGHRGVAKLSARAFQLETLNPLLGAYVSELGGVLDAETELNVTPGSTKVSGQARLEHGVVQLPAIGQRFSEITARVSVRDDQFKLEKLEARGLTGRVSVTGGARLDGFDLRSADAKLTIKKNEVLPITLEGAAIGDAWGNVNVTYLSPAQGTRKLDIAVPEFHLTAPETSGSDLQSLDEPKEIRVGVRRADGVFVALPVQPLEPGGKDEVQIGPAPQPLEIHVKLGNNVTVARGRSAQAQLTGELKVVTVPESRVTGRIEVRGGKLDVQGKTFEIERGVVIFDGKDPGNPTITATARWDAPEYTVYADYVGDVENGQIKLRSEPPLTRDEIASLLLFGSPEGSVGGSSDPNAAALAVSVAGDTAAKGLNQVLDDFTNLDVSARVDTTTGSARPELVFQVSPRVAAKVTRAIGAPAAGESPDRTFLTLELRLKRAWALSAVLGDHGASALDLIWRRRY